MNSRIVFITGATSGIGKETALQLAENGMNVIFSSRSEEKGKRTRDEIIQRTGNEKIDFIVADLASFRSVLRTVDMLHAKTCTLDTLINNAGFICRTRQHTPDGLESQWSVNYFSPFLLTLTLIEKGILTRGSHVINVSASAHAWVNVIDYDFARNDSYSGRKVYAQTKLALNMFTFSLARRYAAEGISANCIHPGIVRSSFDAPILVPPAVIFKYFFKSAAQGALPVVKLVLQHAEDPVTGKYFAGNAAGRSSALSKCEPEQEKLWETTKMILSKLT